MSSFLLEFSGLKEWWAGKSSLKILLFIPYIYGVADGVFRVRRSDVRDQIEPDFATKIFHIHEQFAAVGYSRSETK
jgi:hypothetical protein